MHKKKTPHYSEGKVDIGFTVPHGNTGRRKVMVKAEGHFKPTKRKPTKAKSPGKLTKSILKGWR